MDPTTALLGFSLAALLLTLTPGLDTALVLRTAAVEGGRQAMLAGGGIVAGVLAWGLIAAVGLGAILAISQTAYALLQLAGAVYLLWLGAVMLHRAVGQRHRYLPTEAFAPGARPSRRWFLRGLLTNLLNPKVGVFYVSLLPQFLPEGVHVVAFSALLAGIHAAMGLLWFAALVLATRPLARWLKQPAVQRSLDALTGATLMLFGLRLALARQP